MQETLCLTMGCPEAGVAGVCVCVNAATHACLLMGLTASEQNL